MPLEDVLGWSSTEISEWQAYRSVELLPGERIEMLLATLCALTVNVNRAKDSEPATALDFLPWMDDDDDDDEQSPEDVIRMIEQLNAAFGGADLRGSGGADAQ